MQEKEIKKVSLDVGTIRENIYIIRGQKVMLDRDLAMLYGVSTKVLNQAVKRNIKRFPEDFMFQLSKEELEISSRSQFVTLNDEEEEFEDDDNLKSQIVTSSSKAKNKESLRSQIVTLNSGATNNDSLRSQFATLKNDDAENGNLKSQNATSRRGQHIKYMPMAFTEQGIAMLSSVLKSDRAIQVNIQIIRVFTKLREMIDAYKELREKVEEMEQNNEATFK